MPHCFNIIIKSSKNKVQWRLVMRYLYMYIFIFISTLNIFGDEELLKHEGVIFIDSLTIEQQEEVTEMRTEFLEGFNELKSKLITIRLETQNEMRKDNPDWEEIKKLNSEYYNLQKSLNDGMEEYKKKVQNIQLKIED